MDFLKALFRFITTVALIGLMAVVGAGFAAKQHWMAELATHFVPHIWAVSGVLLLLCIIQSAWRSAGICLLILLWHSYLLLPLVVSNENISSSKITSDSALAMRVLQYNLHYSDLEASERMKWVLSQAPKMDVIVLLEVADQHAPLINALGQQFPYQFVKPMRGYRGVAVFSRLDNSQFALRNAVANSMHYVVMSAMDKRRVSTLSLFVVHPPPPVSEDEAAQRNQYFDEVKSEILRIRTDRKILIGDFNMTRWSPYFRELADGLNMEDSFEGFGYKTTWPSWLPPLLQITIDNLLVYRNPAESGGMVVLDKQVGPANGSDHYPVITTLY